MARDPQQRYLYRVPDTATQHPLGSKGGAPVFLRNLARPAGVFAGEHSTAHNEHHNSLFFSTNVRHYTNENLIVGKFAQFAHGATLLGAGANHNLNGVSAYNFSGLWRLKGLRRELVYTYKGPTIIGNDVWIGRNAVVFSGVHIGDGATIAAHAVVTKDVPAYSVVGGIPARVIRQRYDSATVRRLQRIRWWDWPAESIGEMIPSLVDTDSTSIDQLEQEASRVLPVFSVQKVAVSVVIMAPEATSNLRACLRMLSLQTAHPVEIVVVSSKTFAEAGQTKVDDFFTQEVFPHTKLHWLTVTEERRAAWQEEGIGSLTKDFSYLCLCTENDLLSAGYLSLAQEMLEKNSSFVGVVGEPDAEHFSLKKKLAAKLFGLINARSGYTISRFGFCRRFGASAKATDASCARGPIVYRRSKMFGSVMYMRQARWWPLYSRQERLYGRTINAAMVASYKDAMQQHVLPRNSLAYFGYYWTLFGFWLRKKMGH